MKKNIFRTLVCLLAILLIGCEEEHSSHEHGESRINDFNLQDLPEINAFINSQKSLMGRDASINLLDSIIPENVIVVEESDGTKTYTFGLSIVEPETQMTNLIIDQTNDGFEYFTITYESENLPAWKQEVDNNQIITIPVEVTKNSIDTSLMGRGGDCIGGVSYGYECPQGIHFGSSQGSCTYTFSSWRLVITMMVVPCDDQGGGGGSVSTGPNTGGGGGSRAAAFANALTTVQKAWWDKRENASARTLLTNYLEANNYTSSSLDLVRWAIDYLRTNPSVTMAQIQNWFMKPSEGKDGNYDAAFWENPNLDLPQQNLPSMQNFLYAFPKIQNGNVISNMPSTQVYQLVGGSILSNHASGNVNYQNACSIRGSRALNYAGASIPVVHQNGVQKTEKGGDNENYILSAKAFNKYMNKTSGPPTYRLTFADIGGNLDNIANFLQGKNGIYTIINRSSGLAGYSGHVDIIINGQCLGGANANPPGGVEYIEIWELN